MSGGLHLRVGLQAFDVRLEPDKGPLRRRDLEVGDRHPRANYSHQVEGFVSRTSVPEPAVKSSVPAKRIGLGMLGLGQASGALSKVASFGLGMLSSSALFTCSTMAWSLIFFASETATALRATRSSPASP